MNSSLSTPVPTISQKIKHLVPNAEYDLNFYHAFMCIVSQRGPPSGNCTLNATIDNTLVYTTSRRTAQGLEDYVADNATYTAKKKTVDLTISWGCDLAKEWRCGAYLDSVALKRKC